MYFKPLPNKCDASSSYSKDKLSKRITKVELVIWLLDYYELFVTRPDCNLSLSLCLPVLTARNFFKRTGSHERPRLGDYNSVGKSNKKKKDAPF